MAASPTSPLLTAPCAMQARFGPLMRLGLWLWFRKVFYPKKSVARLQALQRSGTLVYVIRGHSMWPTLCLNDLVLRQRLPRAVCVGGVNYFWMQSAHRLWSYLRQRKWVPRGPWDDAAGPARRQPIGRREAILMQHVQQGATACIGLPTAATQGLPPRDLSDYLRGLLVVQRGCKKPIYLLPHVLIERQMRLADPICLLDVLRDAAASAADDEVGMARQLRAELQRRLDEEERVVAGPPPSRYAATVRQVLGDAQVRAAIEAQNAQSGATDLALEARARAHLRSIAARYDVRMIQAMDHLLRLLFWRIYDGVWVDQPGLQAVVEAARRGPLIFCPAHRSHIDYLVLSYVLWQQGLSPPHIAAGQNLAFFPLGTLFRRCGAFFMRRSFGHDALYSAVFAAYLFDLLKRGTSIEFFLEGSRSRSGKHLMPRFGLLRMLVDAWRGGARSDVHFVPLSIDYDRIIEANSYQREMQGADKKSENIGDLLLSGKVLRSRYGQVQVQFGAPISLAALARERGLGPYPSPPAGAAAWRREVEKLGYRIMHQVAQVGSVSATAVVSTALLGHRGRAMAQHVLLARCDDIVSFLDQAAARLAPALQRPKTRVSAVLEAVQKLVDDRLAAVERAGATDQEPLYRVPDAHRVTLDYHKNTLMNHFAPCALLARALLLRLPQMRQLDALREDCRFLSQLFRHEFLFRVDADFNSNFAAALQRLVAMGAVRLDDAGQPIVEQPAALGQLGALLDSFLQSYWLTIRTVFDLRSLSLSEAQLRSRTLERLRRAYLEGDITRFEAVNHTLIHNAHRSLIHLQVLQRGDPIAGRTATLGLSATFGEDGLLRLERRLRAFVEHS